MAEYINISAKVEEEAWILFRKFVLDKYGQIKGYLGIELTRAILKYVEDEVRSSANGNTHIEHMNLNSKFGKGVKSLLLWLIDKYPVEVIEPALLEFIRQSYGTDPRTEKKYISFLLKNKFIEVLTINSNGIKIFKVYPERIKRFLGF